MAITNNSIYPQPKYEGIKVAPGFETNVGVERTFYYKLPMPYGNCRANVEMASSSDSQFFQITTNISQYTRNLCYEICFQYKYAIPLCGCADASIDSNINNVTYCTVQVGGQCLYGARSNFQGSNCDNECPEACERVKYTTYISQAAYPTK